MGSCLAILIVMAISAVISGCFTWLAFWLLHMVFPGIPVLTFMQAIIVGIAIGILSGFFRGK